MTRRRTLSASFVLGCLLCVLIPRQCRTAKTADPLEPTRLPVATIVVRPMPSRGR
jgi:hypothetical protein